MANMTKNESYAALQKAGIQRKSFRTAELCARSGISLTHYGRMEKKGKGCEFVLLDGVKVHTIEHEAAWLDRLAAESEPAE
jgi:hypothetical protein